MEMSYYDEDTITASTSFYSSGVRSLANGGFLEEITGHVTEIHPSKTFTYKQGSLKGVEGSLKTLVLENMEQKASGAPWFKYRVIIWANVAEKFSFMTPGTVYKLSHFKQVLPDYNRGKGFYSLDIHLLPKSKVEPYSGDSSN